MDADVLVEQYDYVLRRAKVILQGDPDSAEDLVQDAYLHLLETRQPQIRNPRAFLATVVTRKIFDHLRKALREQKRVSFNSEAMASGAEIRPEGPVKDMSDEMEAADQLRHLLNRLPPHLATVLVLCKRNGLTYKEAAVQLGLSTQTVKKHLAAASARCRTMDARDRNGGNPP